MVRELVNINRLFYYGEIIARDKLNLYLLISGWTYC